jgi:hypothetical protein
MKVHKVNAMPPGGCDFWKQPEKENTRLVRLPDAYYEFFRDAIHPALRCFFVLSYNIGRRKAFGANENLPTPANEKLTTR